MTRSHTILSSLVVASACAVYGCGSGPTGTYVLEIEKTLSGILRVPRMGKPGRTLPAFKDHIKNLYAGTPLVLTNAKHHAFLTPVGPNGSVSGPIRGSWKLDDKTGELLLFQWMSGPMYMFWGKGVLVEDSLAVSLPGLFNDEAYAVLHYTKR